MRIRSLTFDDLADLSRLYAFLHPSDPVIDVGADEARLLWRSILGQQNYIYLGVEIDCRVVSTCTITLIPNLTRSLRPYGLIENVVTDPEYRLRGYGTALLKEALTLAWRRNCYKVMLETGRKEASILRFYESAGFTSGVKTAFTAYPPT